MPFERFGTLILVATVVATPARALDEGHWIVAGSFRNPDYSNPQGEAISKASAAVRRCGLSPFNDFSGKFAGAAGEPGFAEGYDVVVVGPYRTDVEARSVVGRLKRCVPNAYVKRARYLGE